MRFKAMVVLSLCLLYPLLTDTSHAAVIDEVEVTIHMWYFDVSKSKEKGKGVLIEILHGGKVIGSQFAGLDEQWLPRDERSRSQTVATKSPQFESIPDPELEPSPSLPSPILESSQRATTPFEAQRQSLIESLSSPGPFDDSSDAVEQKSMHGLPGSRPIPSTDLAINERHYTIRLRRPIPEWDTDHASVRIRSYGNKGWKFYVQVVGSLVDPESSKTQDVSTKTISDDDNNVLKKMEKKSYQTKRTVDDGIVSTDIIESTVTDLGISTRHYTKNYEQGAEHELDEHLETLSYGGWIRKKNAVTGNVKLKKRILLEILTRGLFVFQDMNSSIHAEINKEPDNLVQRITLASLPNKAIWKLGFNHQETIRLPINITPEALKEVLGNLSTIGRENVCVVGSIGGPYTITLTGDAAEGEPPLMKLYYYRLTGIEDEREHVKNDLTNAVQRVAISKLPIGRSWKLQYGNQVTGELSRKSTADQLKTALVQLSGIGPRDVLVTGTNGGPYVITFQGSLSGRKVELLRGIADEPAKIAVASRVSVTTENNDTLDVEQTIVTTEWLQGEDTIKTVYERTTKKWLAVELLPITENTKILTMGGNREFQIPGVPYNSKPQQNPEDHEIAFDKID